MLFTFKSIYFIGWKVHLDSKQIVSALHHQHVIWMILYFLLSSSKGCYFMWLVCWDKQFQENWSKKWTKRKVVLRKRNQWHCTFSLGRGGETTNSFETLQLAKFHARNYTQCGISFKATNIIITFRCAQEKYLIAEFMHMSSFATTYYISRGLVFCGFFFLHFTFQTARKYVCFQQFGSLATCILFWTARVSMSRWDKKSFKRISIFWQFTTLFPLHHYSNGTAFLSLPSSKFNKDKNNCSVKCWK